MLIRAKVLSYYSKIPYVLPYQLLRVSRRSLWRDFSLLDERLRPIPVFEYQDWVYFRADIVPGFNRWIVANTAFLKEEYFERCFDEFRTLKEKLVTYRNFGIEWLSDNSLRLSGSFIAQWNYVTLYRPLVPPFDLRYVLDYEGDFGYYGTKMDGLLQIPVLQEPTIPMRAPYNQEGLFAVFGEGITEDWGENFSYRTKYFPDEHIALGRAFYRLYDCVRFFCGLPGQLYVHTQEGSYQFGTMLPFPEDEFPIWFVVGVRHNPWVTIKSLEYRDSYQHHLAQLEPQGNFWIDYKGRWGYFSLGILRSKASCNVLRAKVDPLVSSLSIQRSDSYTSASSVIVSTGGIANRVKLVVKGGETLPSAKKADTNTCIVAFVFDPDKYPEVCRWFPPYGYRHKYIYTLKRRRALPYMSSYFQKGEAMLYRESDNAIINASSVSVGCSIDNWCWDIEAEIIDVESFNKVRSTDGNPVGVVLEVNGHRWKFFITSWSKKQIFGQTRFIISGISKSAELQFVDVDISSDNPLSAKGIAETILENTGWTLGWLLTDGGSPVDWLIKQSALTVFSKTNVISALCELAKASGCFIYSHPSDKTIYLKPVFKYPTWTWGNKNVDYVVSDYIIFEYSETLEQGSDYNGIIVSGDTPEGVLCRCYISGTNGEPLYEEVVTNRLVTDSTIGKYLATKELCLVRPRYMAEVTIPLFSPSSPVNLCIPGDFIQLVDKKAAVFGTNIKITFSEGLTIKQTIDCFVPVL